MNFALVLNAPMLSVAIQEDMIIAADGGYRHVQEKKVFAVIGDFDTLGYLPSGVNTVIHPADKDKTDGELALDFIKENGGTCVTIYGATGGKIEHVLGNVGLLAYADAIGLKATIKEERESVYFVKDALEINELVGHKLSIIAFGGEVTFQESKGLKYSLDGLKIFPYSSLGISNEITEGNASIKVKKGACIVVISKN